MDSAEAAIIFVVTDLARSTMTHGTYPIAARRHRPGGFTLIEMAVVIVLMGIVMTLGLRMLQATQNNAAYSQTQTKQERIKLALIAFMRTNGRLPCPDSALPPTGVEPAACLVNFGRGVLPWQTLGLGAVPLLP